MVVAEKKKNDIRLIEIELENFKRLNVKQEFDEEAKSVTVSGPNGIGKSTFIDSLFICLTGKEIPDQPIKNGKTKGHIKATLKDDDAIYVATLEFQKDNAGKIKRSFTLRVGDILHNKVKDARALLEAKIGSIYFDVFEFVNMQPRDQKTKLQEILNLDFSDIEGKKRALLDDKLKLESKRESFDDQLNTIDFEDDGKIYEKKDASVLLTKINEARDIEAKKVALGNEVQYHARSASDGVQQIEQLKAKIKELEDMVADQELLAKEKQQKVDAIVVPDISKIQEEANQIDEWNKKADAQIRFKQLVADKTKVDDSVGVIVDKLKKLEQERIDRIAAVKLPVDGLGFGEDGLTYNGLPLNESQISSGELIELGAAIAVGLDPKLRIMRVKDASLLDDKHLQAIQKVADQYGFIVFYEKVANTDELGIQFNEV